MKTRLVLTSLAALGFAAAGAGGGWWYANMRAEMREYERLAAAPTPPGKRILYYHDPMYPQQKFDKPGKSPFMDMQLVPVYGEGDSNGDGGNPGVRIEAAATQNLGVRTAEARMASLSRSIEAVGTVAFDEGAMDTVQARVTGWIEKLYAKNPNDPVAAGAPLAAIYAPDWLAAQEEYLALARSNNAALAVAARARLAFLGIPEAQIAAIEREGRANPRVTLVAPRGGVLLPLAGEIAGGNAFTPQFAKEGMQVAPGMTLFRIASLASVWVLADVPEAQSAALRAGQAVEVRAQALPDRLFKGVIAVLLPEVNPATRTLRARIRVDNPGAALKPGMFAAVNVRGNAARDAVVIPAEAVIATGKRKLVMVAEAGVGTGAGGRFSQREITTGMETRQDGMEVVEIVRGLRSGERVVVSGQFLIDSEASLKAPPAISPQTGTAGAAAQGGAAGAAAQGGATVEHRGEARVESISGDTVTLSHGPIASMKWPEMTMGFRAPSSGLPRDVAVGERVDFSFTAAPDGQFRLTRIAPVAPPSKAATIPKAEIKK